MMNYQVPDHPNSVDETTFVTPLGKYCFAVVPFSLAGDPPTFLMNTVLSGKADCLYCAKFEERCCFVFLTSRIKFNG